MKTEEILDHADELAKRFEDYEPDPGDDHPPTLGGADVTTGREDADRH